MHLDHFEDLPLLYGNRGNRVWNEVLNQRSIVVQSKIDGSVALAGGRDENGFPWVGLKSAYHNPALRYQSTGELFESDKPREVVWALRALLESFYNVCRSQFSVIVDVVLTPEIRKVVTCNGTPMVYGTPNVVTYYTDHPDVVQSGTYLFMVHTMSGMSALDYHEWRRSANGWSRSVVMGIPAKEYDVSGATNNPLRHTTMFHGMDFDGSQMYKLLRRAVNANPAVDNVDDLEDLFGHFSADHMETLKTTSGQVSFSNKSADFRDALFTQNRSALASVLRDRKAIREKFIKPLVMSQGFIQTEGLYQDMPEGVVFQHNGVLYKAVDREKFPALNNNMGMVSNG